MMSLTVLTEIEYILALMGITLLFGLMVIKYIQAVMGMKLRTGLTVKINVFRQKHPLPMLNMYCILELRRGYHYTANLYVKMGKKVFRRGNLAKTVLEQRVSNMTPAQADYFGKQKEMLE